MKVSVAAVLAAATSVAAWGNVTYTTEVVTALTTYCPAPTEITHGGSTYTVTEATTLTITNCPCTITKPVTTVCNSTTPSVAPTTYPTTTKSTVPLVTAGAGKAAALSGAGLAGVLGLAAFVL